MSPAPAPSLADIERTVEGRLRLGAALSALAALIWIGQAALIAAAFERLAAAPGGGADLLGPALGFAALAALRAGIEAAGEALSRRAARAVATEARRRLADRAARTAAFDSRAAPSGAVAALGAEKLDALLPYLARFRAARLRAVVLPLAIAVAIGAVSWVAALALLLAGPLIPLFMALIGMAAKEASERQMDEIGSMNAVLLDRIRGLLDIRLLDAVERVATDFESAAERLRGKTMAVLRVAFLSSAVLELFAAIGVALIAVYIGFSLLGVLGFGAWGGGLTLGEGLFVLMLAPEFFQPLRDFAAAWHDRAAAKAVEKEFDAAIGSGAAEILGAGREAPALPGPATIRLTDVAARGIGLPGEIVIRPGERVALTGPSGAGKSTLLALIAGLLAPEAGRIEVAGRPLDPKTADSWRARLAWVGQRPHFFARSLRANVALSDARAGRAAVERALALAAAEPVAARAPLGLETPLGEAGEGVSGGEARRLAVARAAFRQASSGAVDVILADEPTADLDAETAAAVTDGLLRLAETGAALIVATHDPALIARLDRRIDLGEAA